MDKRTLQGMDLQQLDEYVSRHPPFEPKEMRAITQEFARRCSEIGKMWDVVERRDPDPTGLYGQHMNHKSRTYQLRKAASYEYP